MPGAPACMLIRLSINQHLLSETKANYMMEIDLASQESPGFRSGRLFQGCQESQEFPGFQGCRRSPEAQVFQEFLGCPEFQHQEPLQRDGEQSGTLLFFVDPFRPSILCVPRDLGFRRVRSVPRVSTTSPYKGWRTSMPNVVL